MGYNISTMVLGKLELLKDLYENFFGFHKKREEIHFSFDNIAYEKQEFKVSDLIEDFEEGRYPTDVELKYESFELKK